MRALVLAILAVASAAAADPRPTAPASDARGDCARARKAGKTCELTIEAEDVGGSKPDPGGSDIRTRRFEPAGSLLRIRRDFIDAIVKAADDL
ncbi:MAG TPA: hypothetical protein VIX73_21725 [Kofleriaceae bacterium]|jgi:hypothetical protein